MSFDKMKLEKLEQVFATLKTEFFGIDAQLDEIKNKMIAWYVAPEICIRPTIINLWGMTGVGKTAVVRRIFDLLDYPTYLELQLFLPLAYELHTCLASESDNPPVLVFDEIQRFRTRNERGEEKTPSQGDSGFWELLSDGKISNARIKTQFVFQKYQLEDLVYEAERDRKLYIGDLENYKHSFFLPQSLEELRSMTLEDILEEVRRIEKAGIPKTLDFSNALIFICGNLDEAFTQATNVSGTDNVGADYLHEATKALTFLDIKHALTHRFTPEQIARFGNNHIVYPSLSKAAFKALIENKLQDYAKRIEENSGISLVFSDSVVRFIYEGSVFPAQGARPTLSTIDDFVSSVVTTTLFKLNLKQPQEVLVRVDNDNNIYFTPTTDPEICVNYTLPIMVARQVTRLPEDERVRVAVHEAGHIILGYVVGKKLQYASITPDSAGTKGRTSFEPVEINTSTMYLECLVGLGGIAAERVVFGNVGFGSDLDNLNVTSIIADSIRRIGSVRRRTKTVNLPYSGDTYPSATKTVVSGSDDTNQTDAEIKKQVAILHEIVHLISNWVEFKKLLLIITKQLLDKEYVTGGDLEGVLPRDSIEGLKTFTTSKLVEQFSEFCVLQFMSETNAFAFFKDKVQKEVDR